MGVTACILYDNLQVHCFNIWIPFAHNYWDHNTKSHVDHMKIYHYH